MATIVNVSEAKTRLSRLLARAEAGERIVIARAGRPVAVLGPVAGVPRKRARGHDAIVIHDDFDDPIPEFDADYFHPKHPLRPRDA